MGSQMPRKSTSACPHCEGELVLIGTANPAKIGRVYCDACACTFLYGDLVTRGASCRFSPTEAAAPPSAASANTDVEQ
jgi:hypothetical protein